MCVCGYIYIYIYIHTYIYIYSVCVCTRVCVCVCARVSAHIHHSMHVEVREQFAGVGELSSSIMWLRGIKLMSSGSVTGPLPTEQSRPHVDSTYLELGHKNEKSNSYTPLLTSILVHHQHVTILLYFSCTPIPQDTLAPFKTY